MRREIKVVELDKTVKKKHLMKMHNNRQAKEICQTQMVGKRKKGRPKQNVDNDTSQLLDYSQVRKKQLKDKTKNKMKWHKLISNRR